jgi:hypothetical protein
MRRSLRHGFLSMRREERQIILPQASESVLPCFPHRDAATAPRIRKPSTTRTFAKLRTKVQLQADCRHLAPSARDALISKAAVSR